MEDLKTLTADGEVMRGGQEGIEHRKKKDSRNRAALECRIY